MSSVLMVGVDCSECGDRAVDYATDQARRSNAKLYVAHVIEWSPFYFFNGPGKCSNVISDAKKKSNVRIPKSLTPLSIG